MEDFINDSPLNADDEEELETEDIDDTDDMDMGEIDDDIDDGEDDLG